LDFLSRVLKKLKELSMKKQTLSILVLAGCIGILQTSAFGQGTTIKVNLGLVHSRITGDSDSDSWKGAFGAMGGVAAHIPFNCNLPLAMWAEVNVSMQGAGWEDDWGEGLTKGVTRLWYLNVPLTARYQFGQGFYGEVGIQPGFLLSARDNYEGESDDWKEYFKTFDLGIPLGVGYDFPNNFGINLRVIPGVINVNSSEYSDEYKNHNFVVALRGTYTFPKK
jgi:hypothetical protein